MMPLMMPPAATRDADRRRQLSIPDALPSALPPAVPRAATALLVAATAIFAGVYLASIGPYWNISPDSATYVEWGRSLAAGRGWGSQPIDPPLTSLIFAAVLALFPGSYVALNTLTPLLIFGALALAFVWCERRGGRMPALLVIVLSLASTHLYHASTQLLSEPTYMLVSTATLVMLDPLLHGDGKEDPGAAAIARRIRLREWLAGTLLIATVMTRTIGVALALAVLLVEAKALTDRQRRPRLVLVAFALVALAAVAAWETYTRQGYVAGWFRMFVLVDPWTPGAGHLSAGGFLERIRDHIGLLPAAGGLLLNSWSSGYHKLDALLWVALTLACASGLALSLRRHITVTAVYVALYLLVVAAHMLTGGGDDPRFLVPVLPFLIYYTLAAVHYAVADTTRARLGRWPTMALAALGALYLIAYVGQGLERAGRGVRDAHSSPFGAYPIKRPQNYDAERLALWLRSHSGPDDRYAAGQRDMIDVIAERHGYDLVPATTSPHEAFAAWLEQQHVRYLLVDRTESALSDSLLAVVRTYPHLFRAVSELPRASLYAVRPRPAGGD